MSSSKYSALVVLLITLNSVTVSLASNSTTESFLGCLSHSSRPSFAVRNVLYTINNPSYSSILASSIQNLKFTSSATPKPQYIITPHHASQVQSGVVCARKHGFQIRVRSGGHDYEGLSYVSSVPFVLLDLFHFHKVSVNVKDETAWVQSGTTLGELYYAIAEKSGKLAFPAGTCSTVGVGGQFSGGGLGNMMRKYGLSSDNILDARLIDVDGKLLDRKSMGEDLFWAIRGGGGGSFGVILAWKIRLVRVPPIVTIFVVEKYLEQHATQLFIKWQKTADKFDDRLFIRTVVQVFDGITKENNKTIQVRFQALFLGKISELLPLMKTSFPELELNTYQCIETNWITSILSFSGYPKEEPLITLLNRTLQYKNYFKAKSDFIMKPMTEDELQKIWKLLLEETERPIMIWEPLGGRMGEISESDTPFPHRAGNMFNIQYLVQWQNEDRSIHKSRRFLRAISRLYKAMTPYVSSSPRSAYINYRDLDLGQNAGPNISYAKAKVWGRMYFKDNFRRLTTIKRKVDPENFFSHEQSIPLD